MPEEELEDVGAHVELALRMRPDLNQAKLDVQRDELELVKTKNGLLPKMDLFITLGKTGYADSFGGAASNIDEDYYDFAAGIKFDYPLRNRESEALYRRSLLKRDRTAKALDNLAQLVELDVRSAHIEVNRAKEQISASKATRELQEEKLRIETEKFRVGRSTNFLVSQAQRDLLLSQIAEVQAFANYLQALVDFYRLEGTLLSRRGIEISG
jgi:outer membrane protein